MAIKPVSEIAEIISGGTPKTSNQEYWGGNIPWLSVKDFNNGSKYVSNSEKTITRKGLEHSTTNLLQKMTLFYPHAVLLGQWQKFPSLWLLINLVLV